MLYLQNTNLPLTKFKHTNQTSNCTSAPNSNDKRNQFACKTTSGKLPPVDLPTKGYQTLTT
nr:MAG: hypothetical protein [Apis mellifera filamentous virus]